jgi:hypothetical protein
MAKVENKGRCWYTVIGKALDLVVPMTPTVGSIKEEKKD